MNELLVNEKYDSFYMFETRLKVAMDYYVNGKINKDFFDSDDEREALDDYVSWKDIKNKIFELIKGIRLPISFKVILMFNRDNIPK